MNAGGAGGPGDAGGAGGPDLTRLDPLAAAVMARKRIVPPVDGRPDVPAMRRELASRTAWLHPSPAADGLLVEDRVIGGPAAEVPVRVYAARPDAWDDIIVHLHGGGWIQGGLDETDAAARRLARICRATVVSVDYRLAPEHPYPAAIEDASAVIRALARHRPRWFAVTGDSAGGNLAAALANAFPDILHAQLLWYPALDSRQDSASYRELGTGLNLTAAALAFAWESYAAPEHRELPRVSPAFEAELSRTPAAVIATAGFDPLRDEAQHYAGRLIDAGVEVHYLPAPTLPHGWIDMIDRVPAAAAAFEAAASALAGLRDRAVATRPVGQGGGE